MSFKMLKTRLQSRLAVLQDHMNSKEGVEGGIYFEKELKSVLDIIEDLEQRYPVTPAEKILATIERYRANKDTNGRYYAHLVGYYRGLWEASCELTRPEVVQDFLSEIAFDAKEKLWDATEGKMTCTCGSTSFSVEPYLVLVCNICGKRNVPKMSSVPGAAVRFVHPDIPKTNSLTLILDDEDKPLCGNKINDRTCILPADHVGESDHSDGIVYWKDKRKCLLCKDSGIVVKREEGTDFSAWTSEACPKGCPSPRVRFQSGGLG